MKKLALCVTLGQRPEICPFSLANETSSCHPLLPASLDALQESKKDRRPPQSWPYCRDNSKGGQASLLRNGSACNFTPLSIYQQPSGCHTTVLATESQLSVLILLLLSDVSKASEIRAMRVGG
ncbi:uncharacterized [Tachysurus ichikawai]